MNHDLRYVIFNITELDNIDFSQVLTTSAETVRINIANTQTFVKYEGEMPSSVVALSSRSIEYSHEEMKIITNGDDWTDPNFIP